MSSDTRMISTSLEAPGSAAAEQKDFQEVLHKTLEETENALLGIAGAGGSLAQTATWHAARQIVEDFRPVPWFIWRISNFVFGMPGEIRPAPQGLVFGLRRLLFAAASDPLLGGGARVSSIGEAMGVLKPDVIAAVSVIHALCRKLASKHLERLWRPILDEALSKAQIGYSVGIQEPEFGAGRGMLAGFAGSLGVAILLACGDESKAQAAIEQLARGSSATEVCLAHYGCDPIQVSAMTLSAAGCGRDCAFGLVNFAMHKPGCLLTDAHEAQWLAAFTIIEGLQLNLARTIGEDIWELLDFTADECRSTLATNATKVLRRGHGWSWIV